MSLREEEFGSQLKRHLDQAVDGLRPGVAYRLQQARAAALGRLAEGPQTAERAVAEGQLAGVSGGRFDAGARAPRPLFAQARLWVGIVLIVAAGFGFQQWLAWQELEELQDIDANLLSSELPIDAYLDRDFQQWLKSANIEP